MTEFKVGDRVRYIDDGDEGPITSISAGWVTVDFDMDGTTSVLEEKIELVESIGEKEAPLAPWEKDLLEFANGQTTTSKEDIESIAALGDQLGVLHNGFEYNVRRHTDRIANILIEKNKAYGDSALNPVRVFSKADREEQLYVRIDDKISRIQRGTDFANEDTIDDLIGYLILLKIAKESA